MKCPNCDFENPPDMLFCGQCGKKLERLCPGCGFANPSHFKFCGRCGHPLTTPEPSDNAPLEEEGERKHATVLFSDLSGYTAMMERLDPEEVRRITTRIFGAIAKVIDRYEGFIEKYAGDAVMALFGVPTAHEDDPLRALRAAREIHRLVDALSPEVERKTGYPVSMHTGICTGLVITGEMHIEKGIHGVAGDALNVASRLSGLAGPGEMLVGQEVYRLTSGYFEFDDLGPVEVKGKAEPVPVYRVKAPRVEPAYCHGFSALRSRLIGREPEMAELLDAVANLQRGRGRIFSILGDAGTGKSRLVEEFKSKIDIRLVQWLEAHAYPYTRNIPYFTLMDLLSRIFAIEEEDSRETVRQKIEAGITALVGEPESIIPYVGSLFAIDYPEAADVSPEFWKARLQETMKKLFSALSLKSPTVFLVEDLQWADPSFVELLRNTLIDAQEPALVLCLYRPSFSLFSSHQVKGLGKVYREIQLQPLSPSESQEMLTSLLTSDRIPPEVRRFVHEKAEGNPFYLEEMVNSLIESGTLVSDGESWKLTGPLQESTLSSTIYGIIAGRLDRLEKESKRLLQEASVIGRSFLYEILHRVSRLQRGIDGCLRSLEQMDLIRTKALLPELEYVFKHALTQEVVYNGLLISQRKEIHERIALVMEQLFSDRLPECYEALAFHYSQSSCALKALEYLVKSGEKSHRRYALEESHQYFKQAYKLLTNTDHQTEDEAPQIVDLLVKWGYVYNCRADYKGLEELLLANEDLANASGDPRSLGLFYAWLGWALRSREKLREGHQYLLKALELGEECANPEVIGYACAWLSWTCADRGLLKEALGYGERARELIDPLQSDGEFVRFTLSGLGMTHYFRGDSIGAHAIGEELLDYGQRRSDLRCLAMGHTCVGFSHYVAGCHASAIESFQRAIEVSADTLFSSAARLLLGMTYVAGEQFAEAEGTFDEIMRGSARYGSEFLGTAARLFEGVLQISQGNLSKGLGMVDQAAAIFLESGSMYRYATAQYTTAKVYARIATGEGGKNLSLVARNIGFLVKNISLARRKAEAAYRKAIEVAEEIGAEGILGQAYLDLGRVLKNRKRAPEAKECFAAAVQTFKGCSASAYLEQAEKALADLKASSPG